MQTSAAVLECRRTVSLYDMQYDDLYRFEKRISTLQELPVSETLVASYYNSRLASISQINRPGPPPYH
jgi:hypothetical protein